jgi:hypothetical protein
MRTLGLMTVVLLALVAGLWPVQKAEAPKEPEILTLKAKLAARPKAPPPVLAPEPEVEDRELDELFRLAHVRPILEEMDDLIEERAQLVSLFPSNEWFVNDLKKLVEFAQEEGATYEEISGPLDRMVAMVKVGKYKFSSLEFVEEKVAEMKDWFPRNDPRFAH